MLVAEPMWPACLLCRARGAHGRQPKLRRLRPPAGEQGDRPTLLQGSGEAADRASTLGFEDSHSGGIAVTRVQAYYMWARLAALWPPLPPQRADARALCWSCMAAIALRLTRSRSPLAMQATALAVSAPCTARANSAAAPARQALPACPPRSAFHGASLAAPSGRQQLAAACSRPARPAAASGLRVYAAAKAPWEGKPTAR